MKLAAHTGIWLSAIRGLRDNPLLQLWQLQDSRHMEGRSRWLASPGFMIMALLLSALTCTLLVRQILLLGNLAESGAGPLFISSARWISISSIVLFIGGLCLLLALARLFAAMQFAFGCLGSVGRSRHWTLDAGVQASELSAPEIVSAIVWQNLRRVMPALLPVAICFTIVAGVMLAGMLQASGRMGFQWPYLLLGLLPPAFLLSCVLAVAILSCLGIAVSSPAQHASLPMFAAGNVMQLQLLLIVHQVLTPIWKADVYNVDGSAFVNLSTLKLLTLQIALLAPAFAVGLLLVLSSWKPGRNVIGYGLFPLLLPILPLAYGLMDVLTLSFSDIYSGSTGPSAFTVSGWSLLPMYLLYPLFSLATEFDADISLPGLPYLIWPLLVLMMMMTLLLFARQAARNVSRRLESQ
jgi:hypothetical protein